VYFPYAIYAYHAWTYVLLLSIKVLRQSPSEDIGTLIALGVEVHHPIPASQSKQPFEPTGCRRESEEPCQECVWRKSPK